MAVNKVVYGGETLIDLSDSTVTENMLAQGVVAYGANGEPVTGILPEGNAGSSGNGSAEYTTTKLGSMTIRLVKTTTKANKDAIIRKGTDYEMTVDAGLFGDADASDVLAGKTFTSSNGVKLTGTYEASSGSTPKLQTKTATPTESAQTVAPDSGYDGLSSVTVEAVSSTYVGSAVPRTSAASYTPGTADQTIASGQYLSGAQTIAGDANLTAQNIKSGVTIFGVNGSYEASGGGSGGIQAQHITSEGDAITISGSGTVKVWGYGAKKSSYTTTTYSFVGDGYYSGTSWGTPSKTNATFSVSGGTLSGLPSGLTTVDLLVTIGA